MGQVNEIFGQVDERRQVNYTQLYLFIIDIVYLA